MREPQPHLSLSGTRGRPEAVVLVLHGGRERSSMPTQPGQLAVLRMIPFARRVARAGQGRVAVARLRYAVRGWNADGPTGEPAPLRDTRWALEQLRTRFGPVPIGLLGHSMGGRTALRAGGDPGVQSVVALAPWLPPGEPTAQLAGRRLLLVHGDADRMTSPTGSAAYARRLQASGLEVSYVQLRGEKHGMLRHPGRWHELAAGFLTATLLEPPPTRRQSARASKPNPLQQIVNGEPWVSW
jgi:dienelactone hydrolase